VLGKECRFRVRETPEWKMHGAHLEAEMLRRGMMISSVPSAQRPNNFQMITTAVIKNCAASWFTPHQLQTFISPCVASASPMRVFSIGVENAHDVTVQCSHDADARHHGRAVMFDNNRALTAAWAIHGAAVRPSVAR